MEKRDSIMTPAPRISEAQRQSIRRRSSAIRESDVHRRETTQDAVALERLSKPHPDAAETDTVPLSLETDSVFTNDTDYEDDFIDPFLLMKEVPPYSSVPKSCFKHHLLPPKSSEAPSHTLVLDLDETLVHCYLDKPSHYDISFQINDGEEYNVYLCFRPYVFYFLESMSKYYELVVFTAGIKPYAEVICNLFNSDKKLIHHCLCRDDCLFVGNSMYIKDLKGLDRDLAKTVILDNSPYTFAYNVDNGAPIDSWCDDKNDKKLYYYIPLLKRDRKSVV